MHAALNNGKRGNREVTCLNQVKTVLSIQVFSSFVGGVLGVALPLMMEERNIDIVTIGFVFASMPLIFQLSRMLFATVSDFWGRRLFFGLGGFLGVVANSIYYVAHTPLEFLFGKVMEGTSSGSLWAVNRAFIMEESEKKWRTLVHLRTVVYLSSAFGGLIAGFLVVWFSYEGTMILCALVGASVVPLSLFLASRRKTPLSVGKALNFLDLRKKPRIFRFFLALFFVMGLSFGFVSGFVYPLFLSNNGFNTETIGLLLGLQILLAGVVSFLFAGRFEVRKLILISGALYTSVLALIGVSTSVFAGILIVMYGFVEGLLSICQEGILSSITNRKSYGTDIGLLWMGHHVGRAFSLAMSGLLISALGFTAPFLISAFSYAVFYIASYVILK